MVTCHPPLLLRNTASGKVESVSENGLFLGIFPKAAYSAIEVPFRKEDWLLLYTDGVPEMTNEAEEDFGPERLEQFLAGHAAPPAAEFAGALLKHLDVWSGGRASGREPEDDVTFVVIHFRGD